MFQTEKRDITSEKELNRSSLVVRWLRPCVLNAGGRHLISGQGAGSHLPELKIRYATVKMKMLYATAKT